MTEPGRAGRKRGPSRGEWEAQRPRIKELHDRNWNRDQIASQMEFAHSFVASERQYRYFLEKKMRRRKNLRREELRGICAYHLGRQLQGKKASRYRARNREVKQRDLNRHIREHGRPEPSFTKPRHAAKSTYLTYFECSTLEYERDNPHVQELIRADHVRDLQAQIENGVETISSELDMAPWDSACSVPDIFAGLETNAGGTTSSFLRSPDSDPMFAFDDLLSSTGDWNASQADPVHSNILAELDMLTNGEGEAGIQSRVGSDYIGRDG